MDGPQSDEYRTRGRIRSDDPPNSRLFVMCSKSTTQEDLKESFGRFGKIEEVWVLKDKVTQEPKGIAYIKFYKTSEAAYAMEEMNGRCIGSDPRPLKVLIAHARDQGSRRDNNEEERLLRLFVIVPKSRTEADLSTEFSRYGDVDHVTLVKDRTTRESKGFAYVKYHRVSHAAKAFEECDQSYKPVFAEPKPSRSQNQDSGSGHGGQGSGYGGSGSAYRGPGSTTSGSTIGSSYNSSSHQHNSSGDNQCRLIISASSSVSHAQLQRLLDLVPGLDFCEQKLGGGGYSQSSRGGENQYYVQYNNVQSTSYALEKLHGFEYPPGSRIIVKSESGSSQHSGSYRVQLPAPVPLTDSVSTKPIVDLVHLTETIANATALLKAAGYTAPTAIPCSLGEDAYDPSYCSVKLPPIQPLVHINSEVAERLFIVCNPQPPPGTVLQDIFCRFGNLIEIYIMARKNCGYAKYSSKDSANRAIEALHGQDVCGNRLKVILADPQDAGRKRPKFDD